MNVKMMRKAALVVGLCSAMTAWAGDRWGDGDSRPLDSYNQHHSAFHHDRGDGWDHHGRGGGWAPASPTPEPSEWVFMGIGLALIGAIAYRRQRRN